jgi:glycosyltransferase involved in cell wall biosynthesis
MTDYPKVTFGIIVLNGEPFTKYCLRSIYPFAHEIIVVEGAVRQAKCISTPDGHSSDGTLQSLHEFKEEEDRENKLRIVTTDGFWAGKDEQSQAYAEIAAGDYLWQIDIDEFYMPEDMDCVLRILKNIPDISAVSFKQITFWGDICYRCDSTYPLLNGAEAVHRIFKFGRGYRYVTHRPPTVVDAEGINLRDKKYLNSDVMASKGIYFYHYSLLFPKQVRDKVTYYRSLPYEHCRLMPQWAQENYHRISNPYNVHNVHTHPSWLERYSGKHPPQIYNMLNDIKAGKLNVETRCNSDVEEFIDDPKYHEGISLLRTEFRRRSNKSITITDPIFDHRVFREFRQRKGSCDKPQKSNGIRTNEKPESPSDYAIVDSDSQHSNTPAGKLSIVHINTEDTPGGAAKVACRLAQAQRGAGHDSRVLVANKRSNSQYSFAFPVEADISIQPWCQQNGQLYYEFRGSHKLADNPLIRSADILHMHNLHGGYFNPFSISALSHLKPVVWTLHDMHAITGHCAHSFSCQRWQDCCGQCPDLSNYSPISVDTSAQLCRDKKQIYDKSFLRIVTPSQWLKTRVEQSILRQHPVDLIYNGVDTDVFKPRDKNQIRKKFNIPANAVIIGAVSNCGVLINQYKGGSYTRAALDALRDKLPNHIFVNIGTHHKADDPRVLNIPHISNEDDLAWIYSFIPPLRIIVRWLSLKL